MIKVLKLARLSPVMLLALFLAANLQSNSQTVARKGYQYPDSKSCDGLSFYKIIGGEEDMPGGIVDPGKAMASADSIDSKAQLLVLPNPVFNNAMLVLDSKEIGDISCTLVDSTGNVVRSYQFKKDQASLQQILSMYDIPKGDYVLMVQSRMLKSSIRLAKQ